MVCLNLMDEARRARPRRRPAPAGARPRRAGRADRGAPGRGPARADAGDRRGGERRRRRPAAPRRPSGRRRCSGRSRASATRCSGCIRSCRTRAWVALRLLDGDERIQSRAALRRAGRAAPAHRSVGAAADGDARPMPRPPPRSSTLASQLRWQVGTEFHQSLMEALYTEAARIADRAVTRAGGGRRFDLDRTIDRLVTSRIWGVPLMVAHADRRLLADDRRRQRAVGDAGLGAHRLGASAAQVGRGGDRRCRGGSTGCSSTGCTWPRPGWSRVMLPPMAIFFPMFTLLEDFGYLPRVAFNLDRTVPARRRARQAGADHGDGLGLQRRRRRGGAHHREPARAADRHHHQQLRHLQRPLADADPGRHDLRRRRRAGALGRAHLGAGGGRRRGARRGAHLRHLVAAVAHAAARRGLGVQPRAAAVPPAARAGHALHVAHRSHALRAVARRGLRAAGRRGDLAGVEHPLRRHQPGRADRHLAAAVRRAYSACRA